MVSKNKHSTFNECSIVIPVYKRYDLIRSVLRSISEQKHVDYIKEIIICDSEIGDEIMNEVIEYCNALYKNNVITFIND